MLSGGNVNDCTRFAHVMAAIRVGRPGPGRPRVRPDHVIADSRYIEDEYPTTPTPRIEAYVRTLLERWPDLTGDDDGRSPWSTGGLIDSASGPFVYFPMVYSRAREVSAGAARIAAEHGLVCFDPQQGRLRPASGPL